MDFNFDEIISRSNTSSVKWDLSENKNVLPMWVADMDFKTAPAIIDALTARVQHGVFGYTLTSSEFYEAIIKWWQERNNFLLKKDWIIPVPGIIPALSVIIRAFTQAGDSIIIQSPVYNHFFISIENCGCKALCNNLIYNGDNYSIDFEDLEQKAADPSAKLMLLCNPHNPVGRVWTRDELMKINTICSKHNVIIISDEIHADIVYDGFTHIPFATLNEDALMNSITCASPSKSFNLAGVQVAYLFSANISLFKKIESLINQQDTTFLNAFAVESLIAAYQHGVDWLQALKEYLYANYQYLFQFINTELPQLKVLPLQATYLVWIDCKALNQSSKNITESLLEKYDLWLNEGTMYGANGEGFIRMNIATPRKLLIQGLNKFKNFVEDLKQ